MQPTFKSLKNLLLIFLVGVSSYSCKDKKPSDPNANCTTCHSVLEAKDYFAFKQGSYWVYEEETTHERDSMYVTQSWISAGADFYTEIKSHRTSFIYTYFPEFSSNPKCSSDEKTSMLCLNVTLNKSRPLENLGDATVFFINYKVGDYSYTGSGLDYCVNNKIWVRDIISKYDLNLYSFENVIQIDSECEHAEGNQPTETYYAKGVGIIRKELINSHEVWNLVKYKIAI